MVRHVARSEGQGCGEDDGGGGKVEGALDRVHGELGGDGGLEATGDEVRTAEVGEAAEEGDDGKADELGGQHLQRGGLMQRFEQHGPAPGAQHVAEVGAGEGDKDEDGRHGTKLVAEGSPVEGGVAACEPDDQDEENQHHGNQGAGGEEAFFCGGWRWSAGDFRSLD